MMGFLLLLLWSISGFHLDVLHVRFLVIIAISGLPITIILALHLLRARIIVESTPPLEDSPLTPKNSHRPTDCEGKIVSPLKTSVAEDKEVEENKEASSKLSYGASGLLTQVSLMFRKPLK